MKTKHFLLTLVTYICGQIFLMSNAILAVYHASNPGEITYAAFTLAVWLGPILPAILMYKYFHLKEAKA